MSQPFLPGLRVRPTAFDAKIKGFDWDSVTGLDLASDLELAAMVSVRDAWSIERRLAFAGSRRSREVVQ